MQTELTTCLILILVSLAMTTFYGIRKNIKRVIFLLVIIAMLSTRAGSIYAAIEQAKNYAEDYMDKSGVALEQDENGIPTGIIFKLPEIELPKIELPNIDILPEAIYYNPNTGEGKE